MDITHLCKRRHWAIIGVDRHLPQHQRARGDVWGYSPFDTNRVRQPELNPKLWGISGEKKVSYDHAEKVGNQGDVWKHFILLSVLRYLIEERGDGSEKFRYFDTHAGQGLYTLGEKGEWRRGIGSILQSAQDLSEYPYFQMLEPSIGAGSLYPGSWVLVGRFLASQQVSFSLEICDTSAAVADAIRAKELDRAIQSAVSFHQADGFAQLEKHPDWDLVLIDPPYCPDAESDWKKCLEVAERLHRSGITFLVWYPVFWPTWPTKLVERACLPGFEVLWAPMGQKPSQNQKGCGMLAGGNSKRILRADTAELSTLASLLGGRLFIREP